MTITGRRYDPHALAPPLHRSFALACVRSVGAWPVGAGRVSDISIEQVKHAIRVVHEIWYQDAWMTDPRLIMKLHRGMETLFNFAEITTTLVESNPDEVSPTDFARMTGIET